MQLRVFRNSCKLTVVCCSAAFNSLLVFTRFRSVRTRTIFTQVAPQVVRLRPADLCLPARAWKVKLMGEGADDAGGVFDDTITEMCQVSRSASRSVSRSFGRSVDRSIARSVGLSVGQSLGRSASRSVSRASRLVSRPVDRSVDQSIGQSLGQSVGKSLNWSVGLSRARSVSRFNSVVFAANLQYVAS